MILSIFNTGGLTLVISIIALGLVSWFGYQLYKGQKSGSKTPATLTSPAIYDKEPIPIVKNPFFWGIIIVIALYIVALTQIGSDYNGV